MPAICKNSLFLQKIAAFSTLALVLAIVTGCTMPDKPEGADGEGFTRLGNQLQQRGDDGGAVDFYQRALQHKPDDLATRMALAEILEAHGDNQNAVNQYREAVKTNPNDGDAHRALGRVFLKLHLPIDARDEYTKALQIDSNDVKALNGLGIALDYLGQHDAAQSSYKEALDDQPDDLTTMNNLAHSYVLVGAYGEAITLLEPHLQDKTATPALRQNLAEAYGMAGMNIDAERVGHMDLTPEQVKHNLELYRTRRAQLAPTAALVANLGSFPTEAVAQAQMEQTKSTLAKETEGLVIEIKPEVKSIGGTPTFVLQAIGFSRPDKLRSFCDKLKKEHLTCKAEGLK